MSIEFKKQKYIFFVLIVFIAITHIFFSKLPNQNLSPIVEYMEVLRREPANVDAYFFRAESYYAGKEFRHARLDYEKILKDFPDYKNNKKVKERLNLLKNGGK